ncbi:MAG TPA: AraC family transcriptional regulator [Allosphingosinicella sp.]
MPERPQPEPTLERAPAPRSGGLHGPAEEMSRVLDQPPLLAEPVLRGDTRLTRRWRHGALHDHLTEMAGHVVMTYYGAVQDIGWREGRERLSTRTRIGSITLIPEGHEGDWDISGPLEVSHVYLTEERLRSSADLLTGGRNVELLHRVAFDDPAAARILALLGDEAAGGDASSRLFVEQAIDLLCTQLIRGHSSLNALPAAAPPRGLADWQVKRVTRYMEERLDQDIGLEELAALVGLSRFHFATAFRLATGQPPHAWLTALRIGRARQLLARPELPVTAIALDVGYQTPSSFAAAFRKLAGMTPSEYRRRL